MGAFGEAFLEYIQPLLEGVDNSPEAHQNAYHLGQICWNLAISPEDMRDEMYADIGETLGISAEDFENLKMDVLQPMVWRHYTMFPKMHEADMFNAERSIPMQEPDASIQQDGHMYPGTSPNAPCPCDSGKKYKRCCGKMS